MNNMPTFIPTLHPDYNKNRAHLLAAGFIERTKTIFVKDKIAVQIPFWLDDEGGYVEIYDTTASNVMRIGYFGQHCEVSRNEHS